MIDLEDFSVKFENNIYSEKSEVDTLKEEIEKLKSKLEELTKHIEIEKEKAYQEGFLKGRESAVSELSSEFEVRIKEIQEQSQAEIVQRLKEYILNFEKTVNGTKDSYKQLLEKTINLLSDSISSLLEFLYINQEYSDMVITEINKLIEEFYEYPQFVIKVGDIKLFEILKDRFENVEMDNSLEGLDFIVDFKEFKVENKLKEKLEIVKDEIKREIKKLSEV
ncbi:MAG: CCDC90 family protein [Hydrogenothermaceae bacterium]|nr:CCDC90 family protein [Hydrogenothermaceae bacterium]